MKTAKLNTLNGHWYQNAQEAKQSLDAGGSLDAYQLGKLSTICLAAELLEMTEVYSLSSQVLEQVYEREGAK